MPPPPPARAPPRRRGVIRLVQDATCVLSSPHVLLRLPAPAPRGGCGLQHELASSPCPLLTYGPSPPQTPRRPAGRSWSSPNVVKVHRQSVFVANVNLQAAQTQHVEQHPQSRADHVASRVTRSRTNTRTARAIAASSVSQEWEPDSSGHCFLVPVVSPQLAHRIGTARIASRRGSSVTASIAFRLVLTQGAPRWLTGWWAGDPTP